MTNKDEAYKLLQDKLPDMSMETMTEVLGIIEAISKKENKKKKKEIDPQERALFLQENALSFIKNNYMKYIIVQEGKGYYVIAHSTKMKVIIESHQNVFQPHERTEENDFCCVTLIQYDNINKKEAKEFIDINCGVVYM